MVVLNSMVTTMPFLSCARCMAQTTFFIISLANSRPGMRHAFEGNLFVTVLYGLAKLLLGAFLEVSVSTRFVSVRAFFPRR